MVTGFFSIQNQRCMTSNNILQTALKFNMWFFLFFFFYCCFSFRYLFYFCLFSSCFSNILLFVPFSTLRAFKFYLKKQQNKTGPENTPCTKLIRSVSGFDYRQIKTKICLFVNNFTKFSLFF